MKSLKNHISLTLALFAILFSIQTFFGISKVIEAYEGRLKNNYAIIVVSHANITKEAIAKRIDAIESFNKLSHDEIFNTLEDELSKEQINNLKATLPHYYELKLTYFPRPKQIEKIQEDLLTVEGIYQVENFSQRHDQVYDLLLLAKTTVKLFALLVITISLFTIFKEMRLWQFQHQSRMHIMALFGAPIWLRSAVLFRFAIVDALIASLLVAVVFFVLQSRIEVTSFLQTLKVEVVLFAFNKEFAILVAVSLITSLLLAFMVMLRKVKTP